MKQKTCVECGILYIPKNWNPYMVPICSEECTAKRRLARRKEILVQCSTCSSPVLLFGKRLTGSKAKRRFCSLVCKDAAMKVDRQKSSARFSEYNRVHASKRMRENNPMKSEAVRAKVSKALIDMGHRPRQAGGNGRGPSTTQLKLMAATGMKMEFIVMTKPILHLIGFRPPYHYKLDLADPVRRIAVEVDGPSHSAIKVREADRRKDLALGLLGWTVLRFTNRQVMEHLEDCVLTVMSTTSRSKGPIITSQTEF